jgi:hypothetical protein
MENVQTRKSKLTLALSSSYSGFAFYHSKVETKVMSVLVAKLDLNPEKSTWDIFLSVRLLTLVNVV